MSEPSEPREPVRPELDLSHWPDDAPWKRRRLEKDEAWLAFFTYLGMPPERRTIAAAYREYTGKHGARNASQAWVSWSRVYHWNERVAEYERWRMARRQWEEEQRTAKEAARWEQVREEERNRGLKIGQALIEKAQAMLQFPLAEVERVVSVYDDGREREVQVFKPAGWNFGTVARMIEVGSKLVQLMSQMPTERHHVDLSTVYAEADRVAERIGGGATREDVIAMAERIAQERQERLEEEGRG